jgi:glucose/arabinose dehydrogenase
MTHLRTLALPTLLLLPLLGGNASAQIATERLITGLSAPIFAASPPGDSRIFVVERAGRIRIWDGDELLEPAFLDITADVNDDGEGGLLGLAFAPDYATSRAFYVYYTADGNGGNPLESRISRFRAEAGNPNLANTTEKPLLQVDQPFDNHNGGTIAFGADDLLYMGFGDGGDANDPQDNAQDGTTLLGKMIRIDVAFSNFNDNYTIPPGNPFASPSDDIRDEIWSFGLRNPFRFSFDRTEGDLYIGDVGQSAFEEIDVEPAGAGGRNYGWDVLEAEMCNDPDPGEPACDFAGFTDPVHAYAQFGPCNAVTGGVVYRGTLAALQGQYFFADYCSNGIWSFVWDGAGGTVGPVAERTDDFEPDAGTIGDIVAFGEDGAGNMLIVDAGGEIFRVAPEPAHALLLAVGGAILAAARRRTRIGPHPR